MAERGRNPRRAARASRSRSRSASPDENYPPLFPVGLPDPPPQIPPDEPEAPVYHVQELLLQPVDPILLAAHALHMAVAAQKHQQNENVIDRIEAVFANFILQLANGYPSAFEYELRGTVWNDFEFGPNGALQIRPNRTRWLRLSMDRDDQLSKFTRVVELLGRIKILLLTEGYSTKRELYYENKELYDHDQRNTDEAIHIVGLLLKVPRSHLNILASSKGIVAGHLKFVNGNNGIEIDCMHSLSGIALPQHLGSFVISACTAEMIFIVEKDASFQKFLSSGLCSLLPCILVTGKGYPDLITREFVYKLRSLDIPMYAITDGDPHGFEIMCVYRFGCKAAHYDNICFAAPEIRWLGILPSDIDVFQIPAHRLTGMNERSRQTALELQTRPYCTDAFRHELDLMLIRDQVAEIQAVTTFLQDHFLVMYLQHKLEHHHWL